MKAHVIGVAGPSGSGKSNWRGNWSRVCLSELSFEKRAKTNFDEPASLEWELLHQHLGEIAAVRGFDEPVYAFAEMLRTSQTRWIEASPVVIVEGSSPYTDPSCGRSSTPRST